MLDAIRNRLFFLKPKFPAKYWYFVLCFAACTLFMLFQGGKLAFMLFFFMAALSLYLLLGRYSGIARTTGTRTLLNLEKDMTAEAGRSIAVRIEIQIPGFWPIPYVMMRDRLVRRNGGEYVAETSAVPDWRRRGAAEYITKPLRRGYYHFEQVECVTEDIFGLFQYKGVIPLHDSFVVKPQTVPIREWQQFHHAFKGHHYHSTTTHATRETTQINGVREYIYGDRLSRIHWNATAKTGTWKSKEFERESLPKTVVMIDRRSSGYRNDDQFELAVSIAASLFQYGEKKDLAMGLLSVGRSSVYLEPMRAAAHYRRIGRHLIDVEPDGDYPLLEILKDRARYFSQGCFFVVITPLMDESLEQALNWIYHRQMNPCHIAAGVRADTSRAEHWFRKMRGKGIPAYAVAELRDLPAALGGRHW